MRYAILFVWLVACAAEPKNLSQTGLYDDIATGALAEGVRSYAPQFPLWSDGATKERWIALPAGEVIDTSDMNAWRFPADTRLWKEFAADGVRIETRMLHKTGDAEEDWTATTYAWNAAGTEAVRVRKGATDVQGTAHDIPAVGDCAGCHDNVPGRVLGFSAIQLAHDGEGLTVTDLVEAGELSDPPEEDLVMPGDLLAQRALGTLHANCASCHNPDSRIDWVDVDFALDVDHLAQVEYTPTYNTTVLRATRLAGIESLETGCLIEPGVPERSLVYLRMAARDVDWAMPPLGTERVDAGGADAVAAWIRDLEM